MAVSEKLRSLVDQLPNADREQKYVNGIDKDKIEATVAEIHEGGRENILGLIEMLSTPGSAEDLKPHYALRCLINCIMQKQDEQGRRDFTEILAAEIGGERSKYIRGYLCQELQWAGLPSACPALGKLLSDEELNAPAAMALVGIREGAAEQFRAALPAAKGACKVQIVQGLGAVCDKESIPALAALLTDEDREIRLAAGWGLARMGDENSAAALLKAASVPDSWERIKATTHCITLAEKLTAAGKKSDATKIYSNLRDTHTDPHEQYIRDLAEKALA